MDTIYKSSRAQQEIVTWCEQRLANTPFPCRRDVWETPAGDTHVLVAGEAIGDRTIVFVPGTNFNAASSLPEIEFLAQRHRIVVPDTPGQPGLSNERRVRSAGVVYLGSWLSGVLDRLDRPVLLIGHSLGAAVAMAARSPHITARVLLSPAGIRRLRTPPRSLLPAISWLLQSTSVTTSRLLLQMCAPGQTPSAEQVEWMTLVGRNVRTSLDPGVQPSAVFAESRRSPCFVATGEHDVFVPPGHIRDRVREKLDTHLETLPCGHLLDRTAWNRVDDAISRL